MSDLVPYTTAEQLAAAYADITPRALQKMREFFEVMRELNTAFNPLGGSFSYSCTIEKECDTELIAREMKRTVWRMLINHMDLHRFMTPERKREFREMFVEKHDNQENHIDNWPDITPESLCEVAAGMAISAEQYLDESCREVYNSMKPYASDDYVTNRQNRYQLSPKVIVPFGVSRLSTNYHLNYGTTGERLEAFDTIMHLLDGKDYPKGYRGELHPAVIQCDPSNNSGETTYFKFKCFKNQNLHLVIKRLDLLDEFNWRCGEKVLGADNEHEYHGVRDKYAAQQQYNQPPLAPNGDLNYFQTPPKLVERLLDAADVHEGTNMLEPSAGGGAIVRAAIKRGAMGMAVELDQERYDELRNDFDVVEAFCPWPGNFLDAVPGDLEVKEPKGFDAVVMNPPFSHKRDVAHVMHAAKFLRPGGRLAAVMSNGAQYRQDKASVAFREWLESMGGQIEDLPDGSFKESGTMVNTVLVTVQVPGTPRDAELPALTTAGK